MEERPIQTVELSNANVQVLTYLTWGEKEEIQAVVTKGTKINEDGVSDFDTGVLLEVKYKALETCVTEVEERGEKKQFSREWMNNLGVEDGDKLYKVVDELINPKKKS